MWCQRPLNRSELSQCNITRRQHVVDVCLHRHSTVDVHTKVSGWLDRMDRVVPDLDVSIRNTMTTACRTAPDELRLQCIQLQPVAAHPPPHVVEAPWHAMLEQADISRLTPAVNLRIVRIQVGMQTMFGDQRHEIGGVQHKQQVKSIQWCSTDADCSQPLCPYHNNQILYTVT